MDLYVRNICLFEKVQSTEMKAQVESGKYE